MTERRHLKQLIRARMARTGESYTTARRHLTAASTPLSQHRLSTLAALMLDRAGYRAPHTGEPFSEAMLTGLAGGIGFMYAIFEYTGLPPMLTIVCQHHPDPWLPAILRRLAVPHAEKQGKLDLSGGRPAYCTVRRNDYPYEIVVTASNDGQLVIDSGFDVTTMPEPEFRTQWPRHHQIVLEPGGVVPPEVLASGLRDAIATTVAHLTGPVLGHKFDVNFGFSGMTRLAAQLRDARTKKGWARRFADPPAFAQAVRRLHECLDHEFTAPGATRPLYASFLDEAAPLLGSSSLPEAAELFRSSGAVWSQLAHLEPSADHAAFFASSADLVDEARTLEERAVALLSA
ncbi:DUF4872 domain-containing protein [Paractinoplanes rishiriensis]|uniref:DUF4872 domain-containing protein n=1 Tax=Paractinoplanes rishiriensis TaxID=1050105 RepID=A0A919K2K6_9ACTN|nr:DUF4872 domain-containing protein [Actinoplanes rishiriensis]GIE95471.1 hypothetical protein Ari01nite_29360 [Actinoplanes rishiriensis]